MSGGRKARPSALPKAGQCGGFFLAGLAEGRTAGGTAAQTGTAFHACAAAWHRGLGDMSLAQALLIAPTVPQADWGQVTEWNNAYAADSRNPSGDTPVGRVAVPYVELPVSVSWPPGGGPDAIIVEGTADQIRRAADGVLEVWDVKTGKGTGLDLLNEAAVQLSAYTVAAAATLGVPVRPGGVIRARDYDTGGPVFWAASWDYAGAVVFLRSALADLRDVMRGEVRLRPGRHCEWCPQGGPGVCSDVRRPLKGEG